MVLNSLTAGHLLSPQYVKHWNKYSTSITSLTLHITLETGSYIKGEKTEAQKD